MSRTDLAWLAVAAYALHIMEERFLDWLGSARRSIDLVLEQENYRVAEATFIILGAVSAMVAGSMPLLALSFAAFLLINAIYFHIWPTVRMGQYSPGLITSIVFFLPLVWLQFRLVPMPPMDWILPVIIGGALILSPMALMYMRGTSVAGGSGGTPKARRGRK